MQKHILAPTLLVFFDEFKNNREFVRSGGGSKLVNPYRSEAPHRVHKG
jgi:hypothetical protein